MEGVSDPKQAEAILRKGRYSYKAVVSMCKAGTFAGLKYDVQTGAIASSTAGSMACILNMANYDWRDGKWKQTCKDSAWKAGRTAAFTTTAHVATCQLSRAGATKVMRPATDAVLKKCLTAKTRGTLASLARGKPLTGAAATSHLSKRLRGNLISNGVIGAIDVSVSAAKLASGKISS